MTSKQQDALLGGEWGAVASLSKKYKEAHRHLERAAGAFAACRSIAKATGQVVPGQVGAVVMQMMRQIEVEVDGCGEERRAVERGPEEEPERPVAPPVKKKASAGQARTPDPEPPPPEPPPPAPPPEPPPEPPPPQSQSQSQSPPQSQSQSQSSPQSQSQPPDPGNDPAIPSYIKVAQPGATVIGGVAVPDAPPPRPEVQRSTLKDMFPPEMLKDGDMEEELAEGLQRAEELAQRLMDSNCPIDSLMQAANDQIVAKFGSWERYHKYQQVPEGLRHLIDWETMSLPKDPLGSMPQWMVQQMGVMPPTSLSLETWLAEMKAKQQANPEDPPPDPPKPPPPPPPAPPPPDPPAPPPPAPPPPAPPPPAPPPADPNPAARAGPALDDIPDPRPMPLIELAMPLPQDWRQRFLDAPFSRLSAIAGTKNTPVQFGLLGTRLDTGQPIGIDYNGCSALGLFGVPDSGKTYGLGVVLEGGLFQNLNANLLRAPLCAVVLNHHPAASFSPEILAGIWPNSRPQEVGPLLNDLCILPRGIPDLLVLTIPSQVARMRSAHPFTRVAPITFTLADLGFDGLCVLFGVDDVDRPPLYMLQVQEMLRQLFERSDAVGLSDLESAIDRFPFSRHVRGLLKSRLAIARPFISDKRGLRRYIKPGRLILVDIRDEWLGQSKAMMLFTLVVMALCMHADQREDDATNLMVVADEVHKFSRDKAFLRILETMIRERRHLKLSPVLGSQDPPSVQQGLISMMDMVGVFHHECEGWNRYLGQAIMELGLVSAKLTRQLRSGEMVFWAREWFPMEEPDLVMRAGAPMVVSVRQRASQHGGATRTAVRVPDGKDKDRK